jgi:ABC-2 type transport system permease protein
MKKNITHLIIALAIILAVIFIADSWFFRIDLTSEKRYTLTNITKAFLKSLNEDILIKVYLSGDLNPGFKRLSKATKEMLDEFDVYSSSLQYQFIDPNEGTKKEKKAFIEHLEKIDLQPYPVIETKEDGRKTQSYVFPYAIIFFDGKEIPVNLLDNIRGVSGQENLNRSIEGLEFKLINTLRKLVTKDKPAIAFLEGHGELDELDVIDITHELSQNYRVERGQLSGDVNELNNYKTIIIAKPHKQFSEKDKFVIDKYLMQGGRILWLVDAVNITLDSLVKSTQTMGVWAELNLDDILFKYGVRINPVLIEDIQAGRIPINLAPAGSAPKFVPVPWLYSPLLTPLQSHPVSRNINLVRGDFVSYIDTVGENIQAVRTPLLRTSKFTKSTQVPMMVSLASVNQKPQKEDFSKSFLPVAYAMQGKFPSVFANRPVPKGVRNNSAASTPLSKPTKMVVIADGDIIRNDVKFKDSNPRILPLGYDELTHQTYGNKQFIINAVDYLCDDDGWMELRSRSFTLRLLDKQKLSSETTFWKWLNVILPVLIVVISGIIFIFIRKKRYTKKRIEKN